MLTHYTKQGTLAAEVWTEEVWEDEENYEEASRAVNTVVTKTTVPSTTREILDDPAAETMTATSSSFWVLAHALREFVNREGRLPVSGAVPDMFSDSERYIQLQGIYREKAREDMEQVNVPLDERELDEIFTGD